MFRATLTFNNQKKPIWYCEYRSRSEQIVISGVLQWQCRDGKPQPTATNSLKIIFHK